MPVEPENAAGRTRLDDARIDWVIGGLLRAGVVTAAVLVGIGSALLLIDGSNAHATLETYRVFHEPPAHLRGVMGIAREAMHGTGRGIVLVGVLVLVGTPVARVLLSVFAFAAQRDKTYVAITLVVLGVLAVSLFGPTPFEGESPELPRPAVASPVPIGAPQATEPCPPAQVAISGPGASPSRQCEH